jgi:hypothetical protein
MRTRLQHQRSHQVSSLAERLREISDESVRVASDLIARSWSDRRRSPRRPFLERQFRRLQLEARRLEEERAILAGVPGVESVERHLGGIEMQLADVLAEREEWARESEQGRRRRAEDQELLGHLDEEKERLTAELLRLAVALRARLPERVELNRRVWKLLRLAGD